MGNEIDITVFGGAKIYGTVQRKEIKYNEKNEPSYCVWFDGGAYVEYPEQKVEPVTDYFAKDELMGIYHPITEKVYKSGKTTKDGYKHEFITEIDTHPYIYKESTDDDAIGTIHDIKIDGFDNITVNGSPNRDIITFANTSNAKAIVDNDSVSDEVCISVNCKNIKTNTTPNLDTKSIFNGFKKGHGYINDFK